MSNARKQIERELSQFSYEELAELMMSYDADQLIDLLDAKSTRVGDSAAECLMDKDDLVPLLERVLNNSIRTKNGKLRALFVVKSRGRKCPRAVEIYRHLIRDKNEGVVDSALFGLVFLQHMDDVHYIKSAQAEICNDSYSHERFSLAIQALIERNPYLYSPHFLDDKGVWEL